MLSHHKPHKSDTERNDTMAEVQSNRLSTNPYRVSVMPDDVPSMDVSEQAWSDSATNIPEEQEAEEQEAEEQEESEDSSLDGTYQEMPSPTATKTDLQSLPEPPHHLSKHVLSKYSALLTYILMALVTHHSETGYPRLKARLELN